MQRVRRTHFHARAAPHAPAQKVILGPGARRANQLVARLEDLPVALRVLRPDGLQGRQHESAYGRAQHRPATQVGQRPALRRHRTREAEPELQGVLGTHVDAVGAQVALGRDPGLPRDRLITALAPLEAPVAPGAAVRVLVKGQRGPRRAHPQPGAQRAEVAAPEPRFHAVERQHDAEGESDAERVEEETAVEWDDDAPQPGDQGVAGRRPSDPVHEADHPVQAQPHRRVHPDGHGPRQERKRIEPAHLLQPQQAPGKEEREDQVLQVAFRVPAPALAPHRPPPGGLAGGKQLLESAERTDPAAECPVEQDGRQDGDQGPQQDRQELPGSDPRRHRE